MERHQTTRKGLTVSPDPFDPSASAPKPSEKLPVTGASAGVSSICGPLPEQAVAPFGVWMDEALVAFEARFQHWIVRRPRQAFGR